MDTDVTARLVAIEQRAKHAATYGDFHGLAAEVLWLVEQLRAAHAHLAVPTDLSVVSTREAIRQELIELGRRDAAALARVQAMAEEWIAFQGADPADVAVRAVGHKLRAAIDGTEASHG